MNDTIQIILLIAVIIALVLLLPWFRAKQSHVSDEQHQQTQHTGTTAMEQITRINHIGLRVRSLEQARAFYEKLGFEFIVGPIGPEPVAVMEHPTGININFILNASDDASEVNVLMDVPKKHTGFTHIALEITDRETVERRLNEAGIPITETVELPDGAVLFFVRDPDGNVIEFHQPG
ncbi:MAG: VOC family protein [Nitrosomonadaceae bacterium]